jgi:hypothetical protein
VYCLWYECVLLMCLCTCLCTFRVCFVDVSVYLSLYISKEEPAHYKRPDYADGWKSAGCISIPFFPDCSWGSLLNRWICVLLDPADMNAVL